MKASRRAAIAIICCAAAFWAAPRVIPHRSLRERFATSTAVYDADGRLLRLTLSSDGAYRIWVPLDRISPVLTQATLLQEDRHFWVHPGVNPIALARGAWRTYVARSRREGGSTITMQLARLVWHLNTRTPGGKIRQILRGVKRRLARRRLEE